MQLRRLISSSLIAIALLAGPARAGKLSPQLEARMKSGGTQKVIVYFKETEARLFGKETQEHLIRRLQRNLVQATHAVREEIGFLESESRTTSSWISNAISLEADRGQIERLARNPRVKRIVWDSPVEAEPSIDEGTRSPDGEPFTYGLRNLKIPELRGNGLTGKGVVVGHIDTGADGEHPDLKGRIALWKDFSGENSPKPVDDHGHGTHTAATIVGGDASGTSIGVAPDAKLIVARGIGGESTLTSLLQSMQWMMDPDGNPATKDTPVVCSMSWNTGSGDQQAFYEAIENMVAAGIIANFSAGNAGENGITAPHEHPLTLTSAAIDENDTIASFSSRGPGKYKGTETRKPDISSPGVKVYSALPGGGYGSKSGTSMATPHTAGVIALLFQANPNLTVQQVGEIIQSTAIDLGPAGWDNAYGYGKLDARACVTAVTNGPKAVDARMLVREHSFQQLFR